MIHLLVLMHLLALSLGLGGLICHLLVLSRYGRSGPPPERAVPIAEELARYLLTGAQRFGVYGSLVTGTALAWWLDWEPLNQGWMHFKLLFVFWIVIATRLLQTNTRNLKSLREQGATREPKKLDSLKDNHRIIGYVTVFAFLIVMAFSLWKPF